MPNDLLPLAVPRAARRSGARGALCFSRNLTRSRNDCLRFSDGPALTTKKGSQSDLRRRNYPPQLLGKERGTLARCAEGRPRTAAPRLRFSIDHGIIAPTISTATLTIVKATLNIAVGGSTHCNSVLTASKFRWQHPTP